MTDNNDEQSDSLFDFLWESWWYYPSIAFDIRRLAKGDYEGEEDLLNTTNEILSTVLHEAYPELANRRDLYDQIWKELNVSGLTNTPSLHGTMSGSGLMEKRTTSRGQAFIRFITDPIAESDGKINET